MTTLTSASTLSLYDVLRRFNLRQVEAKDFAPEYSTDLPEITPSDRERLDEIKAQYLHLAQRPCLETLVKMVVLSPLLALAGFYEPPFWLTAEESIELPMEDESPNIRGKIDVLVVQNQLWIVVIEVKGSNYDVMQALPQALVYMMASPQTHKPVYGLALNGRELFFIKLLKQPQPVYALSEVFSLSHRGNDLYEVLCRLKRLGAIAIKNLSLD
ncbi:MAG: type I restriction endonuclease [Prochlorotrichaceae cyanobacterium]|jgi:hypothetical protein